MTTIDSLFGLAIELRNNGKLRESVNVLSKILLDFPSDTRTHSVYSVIGGVHADLGEHEKALINFEKAAELNPGSELASLGLYVTLAKLNRDEEAIHVLISYLKSHPADLYISALEELLEGFEKGYMTDYEDDIRNLAKVNGVGI